MRLYEIFISMQRLVSVTMSLDQIDQWKLQCYKSGNVIITGPKNYLMQHESVTII